MSERAPRGGDGGKATPAAKSARRRTGTVPVQARSRRRLPAIDVDRIVVMRVALVAIVLVFLYLVVWIGSRAFGSGAKQATRIDRVIIDATAPQLPAPAPRTDPGGTRPASP